jgi:hypothetical protein
MIIQLARRLAEGKLIGVWLQALRVQHRDLGLRIEAAPIQS